MAFTAGEAMRGALWAWLIFLGLVALTMIVSTGASSLASLGNGTPPWAVLTNVSAALLYALVLVILLGGAISGIATLASVPIAMLTGYGLARIRALWIHACAYLALGAAVGAAVGAGLFRLTSLQGMDGPWLDTLAAPAVLTAIATTGGWWITARRALRDDASVAAWSADRD